MIFGGGRPRHPHPDGHVVLDGVRIPIGLDVEIGLIDGAGEEDPPLLDDEVLAIGLEAPVPELQLPVARERLEDPGEC